MMNIGHQTVSHIKINKSGLDKYVVCVWKEEGNCCSWRRPVNTWTWTNAKMSTFMLAMVDLRYGLFSLCVHWFNVILGMNKGSMMTPESVDPQGSVDPWLRTTGLHILLLESQWRMQYFDNNYRTPEGCAPVSSTRNLKRTGYRNEPERFFHVVPLGAP